MLYYVKTKPMGAPDIPAHGGARRMYKTSKDRQLTFDGFNQSCGMKLNPKDEYVILADMIDWAAVEAEYSALFKSKRRASPTRSTTSASRSQSSWRTCSESSSRVFFCSISWTRPTVCRRVICWKSRTRRHDGLGRRHPQAAHGRRAARNTAPAAGSRLLWADTIYIGTQIVLCEANS